MQVRDPCPTCYNLFYGRNQEMELAASTDRRISERDVLTDVLRLANRLPTPQRVLVTMRYRDGYTFQEIASICGCHSVTVLRRLRSIVATLCNMKERMQNVGT